AVLHDQGARHGARTRGRAHCRGGARRHAGGAAAPDPGRARRRVRRHVAAGRDVTRRRTLMERILVVDDERAMRLGVTEVLERHGFAVTAVDSGAAALAALAEGGVALVLSDM